MSKKKKIKLAILCTIALTVILFLCTVAFTVISVKSVRKIGNFAVKIDEKNVRDISKNLFLEITRRTAREYSHYFKDAEELTQIIANEVEINYFNTGNDSKKNDIKLVRYKNRDFFVNPKGTDFTAYYWGNLIDNKVPNIITREINSLNNLTSMLNGFLKNGLNYYYDIWIHGKNKFMYVVPESDRYYKNIEYGDDFAKYFDMFDTLTPNYLNNSNKTIWYKPYKDVSGVTVLSVYSLVCDQKKNVVAAAGLDMNLDKLLDAMLTSRLLVKEENGNLEKHALSSSYFHGFIFLMDSKSSIIAFPQKYSDLFSIPNNFLDLKTKSDYIKTKMLDSKNPKVRKAMKSIIKSGSGVETLKIHDNNYFIAYSKLESTGWILGFVVGEDSLTAPAAKTKTQMGKIEVEAITHGILISLLFLVISIVVSLAFFKKYLFNRVEIMISKIRKMAKGEFHITFKEEGISEIAELATTFNYLGRELKRYMKNLKNEIKAREQIEAEVKIAGNIQKSILPLVNDDFKRDEFEIAAKLSSAKDASGDFYDFFFVEEDKVALIIADVAGKGISAAFYMGMAKTLLKNVCLHETNDPAKALNIVNNILSQDNSTMMFVTLFIGYYDIITGKMIYANAGHHEAICINDKNTFRKFGKMKGIALGITSEKRYSSNKTFINKNDKIILYTDGVIEAVSPNEEDYGDERFKAYLTRNRFLNCDSLAEGIIKEIRTFEKDKRYDDVTVLILERKQSIEEIKMNNEGENEKG